MIKHPPGWDKVSILVFMDHSLEDWLQDTQVLTLEAVSILVFMDHSLEDLRLGPPWEEIYHVSILVFMDHSLEVYPSRPLP